MATLGKYTIQIDEDDAHLLSSEAGYSFQVQDRSTKNYDRKYVKARRNRNGRSKPYLHRLIMSAKTGEHIDHINGDGLDNRKANLRLCNRSLNMANARRERRASGFRGVIKMGKGPNWRASVTVGGKNVSIHALPTAELAARVRDYLALDNFGEFATLNFLDSRAIWESAKRDGVPLYARHADDCPKNVSRRKWCKCGAELDGRTKCYVVSNDNRKRAAQERRALEERAAA